MGHAPRLKGNSSDSDSGVLSMHSLKGGKKMKKWRNEKRPRLGSSLSLSLSLSLPLPFIPFFLSHSFPMVHVLSRCRCQAISIYLPPRPRPRSAFFLMSVLPTMDFSCVPTSTRSLFTIGVFCIHASSHINSFFVLARRTKLGKKSDSTECEMRKKSFTFQSRFIDES